MATVTNTVGRRKRSGVQGAMELGPRSLALLRRIELALELLVGHTIEDPGQGSENEDTEEGTGAVD